MARCIKRIRSDGRTCGAPTTEESDFCSQHSKNRPRFLAKKVRDFYSRGASVKLKDKFAELRQDEEVHDLAGEVEVARLLALDAFTIYDKILNTEGIEPEKRAKSFRFVTDSIEAVASLVAQDAKVKVLNGGTVPLEHLEHAIAQINTIIEEELAEDHRELCDRIVARLDEIKLGRPKAEVVINLD